VFSEGNVLRRTRLIVLALLVCAPSLTLAQESHKGKNVLALYWYGREYPTNVLYERGLLRALRADPLGGPEYYSEYIEVDRFPEADQTRLLRDYVRQKYANHRIDVIVASAETPFEFLLADRSLFAGVPIVYTAFGPMDAAAERSMPGVAGVFIVGVYSKTLEAMRTIHPDTRQVFVVTSLPNAGGKARENIIRKELGRFEHELTITYLTDLPTSALVDQLSHAPPKSLVLYVRHAEDSSERALDPIEAASLLARVSSVPVYSIARVYLGQGIVGGYLADHEVIGAQAGELVLRLLSGTQTEAVQATSATLAPMFDWRALERWKIDPARLPPGSDIRFRVPTAWELYRGYIVGAITLLILQGLMIAALVVQRSRRREFEARNAAMLSAAPDMMFLLTKEGVYLDYHASDASRLFTKPASFIGRHMIEVLPASVAASFAAAFERLSREPGPIIVEYALPMNDGEHHYEARVVPCRSEVLAVVRDITDQKRSQQALNQTQADLSRLSRLTALGEFAASIAHEIRQPLTGILVNATTCLRWLGHSTPDLSEVRAALSDVVEAGQRANEIIRRNRELFRHHTVQMTALDLNMIIRDVESLARSRLQAGNVRLITIGGADVPPVHGDRVELQQVLLNLIVNSIDAMEGVDADERCIEISSSLGRDGSVKVSVRDSGVGLAGVDRERMFALAYTTKPSGSGVGLSISRSIVEAHGGRLWAEENAPHGATFSFTLPAHSPANVTYGPRDSRA
jgi:signal transduction histidine kinase